MSDLKALSTSEVQAQLFDRIRNRPAPDPNRPRPVLDAIKTLLTGLVGELGPTLTPLLLQLLQKLLSGAAGASAAGEVSDLDLVNELIERGQVSAAAFDDLEIVEELKAFVLAVAQKVGPDFADFLMRLLVKALSPKGE